MTNDEQVAWKAIELARQGKKRAEIAAELGLSVREYARLLERVLGSANLKHYAPTANPVGVKYVWMFDRRRRTRVLRVVRA